MSFWDIVWFIFITWVFVAYLMVMFRIIWDIFRNDETSGVVKALWIVALIFVPFLTALVYLIARGDGMRERAIKAQNEAKHQMDTYIQEQAHTSPADELHKLQELKEKGALSSEEFDKAKAKLLT